MRQGRDMGTVLLARNRDRRTVLGASRLNLFLGLGTTSKLVLLSAYVEVPMSTYEGQPR